MGRSIDLGHVDIAYMMCTGHLTYPGMWTDRGEWLPGCTVISFCPECREKHEEDPSYTVGCGRYYPVAAVRGLPDIVEEEE